MHDIIIFMDSKTRCEICQYIGKGFMLPNVGEFAYINNNDEQIECEVVERIFTYGGDRTNNCVVVTIWVKVSKEESNDSSM